METRSRKRERGIRHNSRMIGCIMTRSFAIFLLAVLAPAGGLTGPELKEDPPSLPRPDVGRLVGRIIAPKGQRIVAIKALCREEGKDYRPSSWDARSGRFVFEKLPGDACYDIQLVTDSGRRLEGINLDYVDARLLRIADKRREQLGLPPEAGHKFTQADARELAKYVEDMKDFMDVRRVLYIRGHGRRATLLVELVRTRRFHARSNAEVIWRIELWYFERGRAGWRRVGGVERVVERRRLSAEQWSKLHVEYFPELTARLDATGTAQPLQFRVPVKADPSRGRVPGGEIILKTDPHVLGLADCPPTATRPDGSKSSARPSGQAPPER